MRQFIVVVTLFFLLISLICVAEAQKLPDGVGLFIEAMRCRAQNHTFVHSLSYVTEQTYQMPSLSEEEIEREADEEEAAVRQAYEGVDADVSWLNNIRNHVRKRHMKDSVLSRFTVRYKAPSFLRKLLSLQIERVAESPQKWNTEINVIERNVIKNKASSEGVVWFPQNRSARVNVTQSYTETLLNFGRLQGPQIMLLYLLLFQDTDVEKYEFSEKNIARFKEELKKLFQQGTVKALQTKGTVSYDGNAKAYVVESSIGSQVVERYWIDVNRGYVCPLLQYYDDKGKLLSEYKSENYFKHEKSGLWFPQLYKEMTTKSDGKQEIKEYRIDKASLDVNFPIADEEFAIEIPEGAEVIDERKDKKSERYMATSTGVLSLGKDGLNLGKMDWLVPTDISAESFSTFSLVRFAFIVAGALLILYGLFGKFIRKAK